MAIHCASTLMTLYSCNPNVLNNTQFEVGKRTTKLGKQQMAYVYALCLCYCFHNEAT